MQSHSTVSRNPSSSAVFRSARHITSRDVAAKAGVSQSAVSRCFTQGASIADATRERVMQAAAELGYRPNVHARNLITGRSRMVGVVLAHLDNLFYPRFLQLLTERLQTLNMQVLLFVADGNDQAELMSQLLNYRVDGIVLAATTLNAELAKACTDAGIPVVLFNRVPSHALDRAFHSVQTHQEESMRRMTHLLIEAGHQRIAYLAGSLATSTNQARESGCRQALKEAGQSLYAYGVGDYLESTAIAVVRQWYGTPGQTKPLSKCPDAIVVADDRMALAVMDTLRHELGIQIPQQVSVVGFDDVPQAAWPAYELTTCAQPLPDMIEVVVELLTQQLQQDPPPRKAGALGRAVVLPAPLQIRGSARVLPQKSSARRAKPVS
jgi:DNA-binding LacI/PurR family transcriptional regulator